MNPALWPVPLKAKILSTLAVAAWGAVAYQVLPSLSGTSWWLIAAVVVLACGITSAAFVYLAKTILNGPKEDAKIRERITKLDGGQPEHAGRIGRLEDDRFTLREDLQKALSHAQTALHEEVRAVSDKVDRISQWVDKVDPKLVVRKTERSQRERRQT